MANPKIEYDKDEVEEIIQLKLKKLGGVKNKLTPNSVKNFNEEIAANHLYIRTNGQQFKKYSYTFWIDKNYYGNQRVREIKLEEEEFILAGEAFTPQVQDIVLLVKKYMNNQQQLTDRLIKLFKADKEELAFLRNQVSDLKRALDKSNENLEKFKSGFATVFMNSMEAHNSLIDVMSLNKSEDELMHDEIKTMFDNDLSIFGQLLSVSDKDVTNPKVLKLSQPGKNKRKALEDAGF